MYPFSYTIQGFNDADNEFYLENGIGFCESFKDAADILEQRYGDELASIKHLELYAEDDVIALPEDAFNSVINTIEQDYTCEIPCDSKGKRI